MIIHGVTIFANIRINSKKGLNHLRRSYYSFNHISDNWLINVRGRFRDDALGFLRKELGNKGCFFSLLDDKKGWMRNSLVMLLKAKYDYVFLWNEDHVNTSSQKFLSEIIKDLYKYRVDFLPYSWWYHYEKFIQALRFRQHKITRNIYLFRLTEMKMKGLRKKMPDSYIISHTGIFRKSFLRKLMETDKAKLHPKIGYYTFVLIDLLHRLGINVNSRRMFNFVNRILLYRLSKYPKETPFEIEKDIMRGDVLPFLFAYPKQELFACIDDDNGVKDYQLNKRRGISFK